MKPQLFSMKFLCCIVFVVSNIYSQTTFNQAKMDSLLDVYEQKNKLMLTLAIGSGNQTIYKRAIGYCFGEGNQKIKTQTSTKFRIGSITKTFTAVMILQLIEEKKLKLSTPLSKFYPKFLNAKKITIEHLLKHRTGIHNFTDDATYLEYMYQPKTAKELMDIFMNLPSDFEPGLKHEYSNTNYVLLGWIVERLTKKAYAEALKERITSKLGLQDTYCGATADVLKNEAVSYIFNGTDWTPQNQTDMSIPLGAGMIVSTAEDLTRFIEGVFDYRLLKKETVDQMIIQQEGYGMGVYTVPFYDRTGIGHNGRLDGFESAMYYFPSDHTSIGLSVNGINTGLNEFLVGVLSIYYHRPYTIPSFYTFQIPENVLNEYSGIYYSETMQLNFYVTKEGNVITAQAEGQSAFPLDAKTESTFSYEPAKLEIEFKRNMSNQIDRLILKQSGMEFIFTKLK